MSSITAKVEMTYFDRFGDETKYCGDYVKKEFLVKILKMGSINLKRGLDRTLSQSGGDVMGEDWLTGRKKKISELACADRAYTGCRNPTATSRQRLALMLMMSRQ